MGGWLRVMWLDDRWGVDLSGEHRTTVGVVEAAGENLFALMDEEERAGLGLSGWVWSGEGWWRTTVSLERVESRDFVPGADELTWRVMVGRR